MNLCYAQSMFDLISILAIINMFFVLLFLAITRNNKFYSFFSALSYNLNHFNALLMLIFVYVNISKFKVLEFKNLQKLYQIGQEV